MLKKRISTKLTTIIRISIINVPVCKNYYYYYSNICSSSYILHTLYIYIYLIIVVLLTAVTCPCWCCLTFNKQGQYSSCYQLVSSAPFGRRQAPPWGPKQQLTWHHTHAQSLGGDKKTLWRDVKWYQKNWKEKEWYRKCVRGSDGVSILCKKSLSMSFYLSSTVSLVCAEMVMCDFNRVQSVLCALKMKWNPLLWNKSALSFVAKVKGKQWEHKNQKIKSLKHAKDFFKIKKEMCSNKMPMWGKSCTHRARVHGERACTVNSAAQRETRMSKWLITLPEVWFQLLPDEREGQRDSHSPGWIKDYTHTAVTLFLSFESCWKVRMKCDISVFSSGGQDSLFTVLYLNVFGNLITFTLKGLYFSLHWVFLMLLPLNTFVIKLALFRIKLYKQTEYVQ